MLKRNVGKLILDENGVKEVIMSDEDQIGVNGVDFRSKGLKFPTYQEDGIKEKILESIKEI